MLKMLVSGLSQFAALFGLDQDPFSSTLEIAVMVFQLRVVAGIPKIRSNVPR
jgi:hypothetical protein